MIDIHRELAAPGHTARMLIQVHDELVFEVPEGEVESEAAMIRTKMEGAIELQVPVVVRHRLGTNVGRGQVGLSGRFSSLFRFL